MNEPVTIPATNSFAMLRTMVGLGILCGFLIVVTYEGTLPRVEKLKAEALERAIFNVIPGITSTKAFTWQADEFVLVGESGENVLYAGYDDNGRLKGIAIEASGQGYADIIRILYGYNPTTQKVIGFYVLESKETPGLGDKIEKDVQFLENFNGLDVSLTEDFSQLENKIVPVKSGTKQNLWEVDGITGATISSRAIANIINTSAQEWAPIIYQYQDFFKQDVDE